MSLVSVIGIDGGPLSEAALARIGAATLVVGSARHLDRVPVPPAARTVVLGELAPAIDTIAHHDGPVAVLASGDPGFFGIARILRLKCLDPEVFPAVSSVAAACARAGVGWEDLLVVSAHGRALRRAVNACCGNRKVAVLTGPGAGPAELAAGLLAVGGRQRSGGSGMAGARRLVVATRLGEPDETIVAATAEQAAARVWDEPNLVLVLGRAPADGAPPPADGAPPPAETAPGWASPRRQAPQRWALPDTSFTHRDGMLTKAEVRAFVLGLIGPGVGDLVWDVGAGSGSIGVECARFGAAVIAVDRDPEQLDRVRTNAVVFDVDVATHAGVAPQCLHELPDPDAVFVGGGGLPVVAAAAQRALRGVVVALAALDRVAPARDTLRAAGWKVEGTELCAARFCELPDGGLRLAATNPVFLVWGLRP
ncbi:MAG TPA: precorrin-6y C5,15-methyltransferase (decarboxylating) subunit CbiE [Mycobacteriales bacterium]|nr:precorrin-6y C5,15-methyltransferase (decarboxylating) subunit CbiE [Mycobacteriales bacterium]